MPKNELVYSFDLGSGSIGVCVRSGKNILYLDSLLIDNEFASVKEVSTKRRQRRTRIAHKEREKWWDEQAKRAGIEVLQTARPNTDKRMLTEFLPQDSKDKTIYSSHLLRIALL
jgi:CRISPR-associated endonuclease Csn1